MWSVVRIVWCVHANSTMCTQVCTTQHTFECSHSTQLTVKCNVDKCKSAVAFTRSPARIHRLCHAPSDTGHRCACLRWTIIVIVIPIIVIFILTIVTAVVNINIMRLQKSDVGKCWTKVSENDRGSTISEAGNWLIMRATPISTNQCQMSDL